MEGNRWKIGFWVIALGGWVFLSPASPSFAQGPPGAAEGYAIQRIEVTKTESGPRVSIEGSKSFEYTVFRLANPLRVVIELPEAKLGKLAGPMEVRDGTIGVIQNRQLESPQMRGARIEIGLEQMVEYDVIPEGNFLYLNFGKPAIPLPPVAKEMEKKEEPRKETIPSPVKPLMKAKSLRGVDVSAKPEGIEVGLKGDGPIPDYNSFQLARPTRLAVDLPKMTNASGKANINVGNQLLKEIRIGQHPDKIRVVFVFPEAKIPPYQLAKEEDQLKLILGETRKEAPAAEKAPPVEPPKPVQVAQALPQGKQEAAPPPAPAPEKAVVKEEKATPVEPPKPIQVADPPRAKEQAPAAPPVQERPPVKEEKTPPPPEPKSAEPEKAAVGAYKGTKISLDFKDADIHNIFRLIAEVSNLNIITSEDVKGKITIRLVNVPWDQALEVILATKNLIKTEEGNVLRITTIETLRKEREEKQKEEETLLKNRDTKVKLEEPARKIVKLSFANVTDLQKMLMEKEKEGKGFLSPQGTIKADTRTNTLIIQDVRSNLEEIEQLIRELDSPTPQVLIEARVVQATTTFARAIGVQWGGSFNQTGTTAWGLTGNNPTAAAGWGFTPNQAGPSASTQLIMPSNFVVNFPASTTNTPSGGMGVSFGKLTGNLVNLDLRLQLGETDGSTKVIARPKLATLDNQEAHVKQGEKIPYETTSQAGTQVQFIDAVLQLKVKPHVTPNGSILMTVKINRDARGSFRSPVNQVPSIDTREAETQVLVNDGETLVIGGIYETEQQETETGIPWLMKIPVLGWLFKSQEKLSVKKELLIFLTPTVIQKKSEA
ncbi:MAG: type IV pilus secretin PilQ [Syntrophaceae bacterium]|nr:type IV pilus secretin PilQ [Syntrophaceae bacterium]